MYSSSVSKAYVKNPPSITNPVPVINFAESDSKNIIASAISVGSIIPIYCYGILFKCHIGNSQYRYQ